MLEVTQFYIAAHSSTVSRLRQDKSIFFLGIIITLHDNNTRDVLLIDRATG